MTLSARDPVGSVGTLWRYPVKSMLGEELNASTVTERGLLGDRAFALVDSADGKIASAKNPRKWPRMFAFRAALAADAAPGESLPAVRITLPDGDVVTSEHADRDERLSDALDRAVTLQAAGRGDQQPDAAPSQRPRAGTAEEYWPDMDGLDYRDTVTDFDLPQDTFFDCATIHLLTTATLDRLRELYPHGRLEVRRFRPNIVVETSDPESRFAEDAWIGHTIQIGDQLRLSITGPCPRCVMTNPGPGRPTQRLGHPTHRRPTQPRQRRRLRHRHARRHDPPRRPHPAGLIPTRCGAPSEPAHALFGRDSLAVARDLGHEMPGDD